MEAGYAQDVHFRVPLRHVVLEEGFGGVSRVPIGGQWLYESGDLEGKEIQTRGRETKIPLVPQAHRRYEEKGVWAGDYPVGVDGLSDGALAVAGVGVVEVVKTPADYEAGVALVEVVRAPVVQE